jgi:hypothetical protein
VRDGIDPRTVVTNTRHVAEAVGVALLVAKPECVEAGCNATRGLEIDHDATPHGYADTGVTRYDQLTHRCRPDHRDRTLGRGRYRNRDQK